MVDRRPTDSPTTDVCIIDYTELSTYYILLSLPIFEVDHFQ